MVSNNPPLLKEAEVFRSLEKLKSQPITTEGSQDSILTPIYALLMNVPRNKIGVLHWFCKEAEPVVVEASTFLLRLHAYTDNPRVNMWRKRLADVLRMCCGCVQGYIDAKTSSRDTYFSAFSTSVLDTFFSSMDKWEISLVLEVIKDADVCLESRRTLSDVPTAVLYHILAAVPLFENPEIFCILREFPPVSISPGWPNGVPPGLLLLLFHERDELRTWAQQQMVGCSRIAENKFSGAYEMVFQAVTAVLATGALNSSSESDVTQDLQSPLRECLASSPSVLWSSLQTFLRVLPDATLRSESETSRMLRRAIIGHLHDQGSHFVDVLRGFTYLVKKLGKLLWQGEDNEYPQVIFDSIKDNTAYMHLFQQTVPRTMQLPWFVQWIRPYLDSIDNVTSFGELLKKVVDFTCEELQRERFETMRPLILASTLSILYDILQPIKAIDESNVYSTITHVLDIHADVIVGVALSPKRNSQEWQTARFEARKLLGHVLGAEVSRAEVMIYRISDVVQKYAWYHEIKQEINFRPPTFHQLIWKKVYETVADDDSEGILWLFSLVAPSAYLDQLSMDAFNPVNFPVGIRQNFAVIISAVNTGLHAMRSGFSDLIARFTTASTSQVVRSIIQRPDLAKHLITLLFSPVEDLQLASQILLGQAYDVDVRSDCFRALLQDIPVGSFEGLLQALLVFNDCAPLFPEACNIAKSLVRCMTDVIEVLSNGHDGLLFDERFGKGSDDVRPQLQLPKLWRSMCDAITIIFRRTPTWSKLNEPEAMIDWMRDALIFARDLVAQRRTFEAATISVSHSSTIVSPRKPSQTGRSMMNDLQPVLTESIRWLRLTDMELLHQSSNLVQSLMECFREMDIKPSPDSLTKLEKFLDSSRRKSIPEDQRTKLSESHLSELTAALSIFNQDDDDDTRVIGETRPTANTEVPSNHVVQRKRPHAGINKSSQRTLETYMNATSNPPDKTVSHVPMPKAYSNGYVCKPIAQKMQKRTTPPRTNIDNRLKQPKLTTKDAPRETTSRSTVKNEAISVITRVSQTSSASSSSESDNEDGRGGLASLGNLQKTPLIKKPTERRAIKLMEPKFSGHNATLDRIRKREEAQRASLRMKPDLRPLYRTILSWNYDHSGSEPPNAGSSQSYLPIMDRFTSDQEYQRTFEPLLILECWNQLIRSKQEPISETLICKINSRQYINEWLDLDVSIADGQLEHWRLAETDVVLLRKLADQDSILAKVQSSRRILREVQITLRCFLDLNVRDPGLHINTQWRLTKVLNLSTITREFGALKALPYYDFSPEIMKPRPSKIPTLSASQVQQTMKAHQVNKPQAIAILGAMQTEGFSLVQGPPGTGKTWTICGIVGAFLSTRPRPASLVQIGRTSAPPVKTPSLKMLVCAPSNAAIDEVAKRLKDGVRNSDGCLVVPNIVRIGADEAINTSVKDISLDHLVSQRLNTDPKQAHASSNDAFVLVASLRTEMHSLRDARALKIQEMNTFRDNSPRYEVLEDELKLLNIKRMSLSQQLNRLKDQQQSDLRTLDAARRKYRAEVLMDADVICSTLSGAGHDVLESHEFEIIVIDEAAQSVELSSLIPLKYRCKRCIMVGDPQQLPPTVLSPLANKVGYGQSLFVRLQRNMPEAVHLLSIQYRMHPDISRLPSKLFYAQRLIDGPDMAKKTSQLWHKHPLFGTYKFINVASGSEQQALSGHSFINRAECEVAVALYNRIKNEYSDTKLDFRIGVITMYRAQLSELKKRFLAEFGSDVVCRIDFNTVDGFQGQEKDIIILSCVRAGPGVQSIGFLSDQRRLNVAITRARASLFILGHVATLERSDQMWKEIVQDARGNGFLLDADSSTYRRPSTNNMIPRIAARSAPTRRLTLIPSDLKTPKDMMNMKSQVVSPTAGPSPTGPRASNAHAYGDEGPTPLVRDTDKSENPKKRRNSDGTDTRRPAPLLRNAIDPQRKIQDSSQPARKRPKQISMFIPKKNSHVKQPPPNFGNTARHR